MSAEYQRGALDRAASERADIVDKYDRGREDSAEIDAWEDETFIVYKITDRYGFMHTKELPERDVKEEKLKVLEVERVPKWLKMLKNWDKYVNSDKLHKRVYKGIPHSLRGEVWSRLLDIAKIKQEQDGIYEGYGNSSMHPEQPSTYERMRVAARLSSPDVRQIDLDVNRTYRNHIMFRDRYGVKQQALFHVLSAYSIYNTEVGYCQGMSEIAALMLMYLNEEDAFWAISVLLTDNKHKMHGFFIPGFPKLLRFQDHHDKLLAKFLPKVKKNLDLNEIHTSLYSMKWFFQCFLSRVPFRLVLRLWDIYILEGESVLTAMALTVFKMHKKRIAKMEIEHLATFFQRDLEEDFGYDDDEVIDQLQLTMNDLRKQKLDLPPPPKVPEVPQIPFGYRREYTFEEMTGIRGVPDAARNVPNGTGVVRVDVQRSPSPAPIRTPSRENSYRQQSPRQQSPRRPSPQQLPPAVAVDQSAPRSMSHRGDEIVAPDWSAPRGSISQPQDGVVSPPKETWRTTDLDSANAAPKALYNERPALQNERLPQREPSWRTTNLDNPAPSRTASDNPDRQPSVSSQPHPATVSSQPHPVTSPGGQVFHMPTQHFERNGKTVDVTVQIRTSPLPSNDRRSPTGSPRREYGAPGSPRREYEFHSPGGGPYITPGGSQSQQSPPRMNHNGMERPKVNGRDPNRDSAYSHNSDYDNVDDQYEVFMEKSLENLESGTTYDSDVPNELAFNNQHGRQSPVKNQHGRQSPVKRPDQLPIMEHRPQESQHALQQRGYDHFVQLPHKDIQGRGDFTPLAQTEHRQRGSHSRSSGSKVRSPTGSNPRSPAGSNPRSPAGSNPRAPAGSNPRSLGGSHDHRSHAGSQSDRGSARRRSSKKKHPPVYL
ncbi:USP6NL [Branchiostoma lanceolatum]|uniref:USP6 N-terminal-like protein n=1 Tax=Branchiostoma lanceolatum TaxID=7740 RepID=A0A8K0EK58_BRALA|nr:USP6NL [Branchiostoma lanceolatum]